MAEGLHAYYHEALKVDDMRPHQKYLALPSSQSPPPPLFQVGPK